jgi:hypothetical protein
VVDNRACKTQYGNRDHQERSQRMHNQVGKQLGIMDFQPPVKEPEDQLRKVF